MKNIIIFLFLIFALNVNAVEELKQTRKGIAENLNNTVKELKDYFRPVEEKLANEEVEIEGLKDRAIFLKEVSKELENNPTVLIHGEKRIRVCDTNEELHWDSSAQDWSCKTPMYRTDCQVALDEYKYTVDGKQICSKTEQGVSISSISYWKFRGYAASCGTDAKKAKIYGCYYKNKLNSEIQIDDSYCLASKPYADAYICYASWSVGGWSACNKSCGGGTQTRSVTCPVNRVCNATKPATSQSCNTQACARSYTWKVVGAGAGGPTSGIPGTACSKKGDKWGANLKYCMSIRSYPDTYCILECK